LNKYIKYYKISNDYNDYNIVNGFELHMTISDNVI